MGARELQRLLGDVSRQRAYQISIRPGFPPPVASLAQGKVWLADDVEAWARQHRRGMHADDDME
jgi:hypothetical protein